MPEDLKLSQIGSSQLPPPFRGLHSPGVRKHCQIIFACYFRKSSIVFSSIQNIILNRPIRKARFYGFRPLRLYTFPGAMAVASCVFEVNLSSASLSTEMHNIVLIALAPSWQL